ncbi:MULTISPECIES: thioesterase II family protein [Streptomyces]|uniref:thioesterase II family protein n=1 Tax=Streptomyces TaxID=1883 RepID=UPI00063FE058|nr:MULTISPECIES: alpha/beta fold hydrolase [unclassified Streptomyces]MBQ1106746.1 thioesterase [Streptomyces sp. 404i]MBQ1114812.1 thioesterase [Streptomyces sp. C3-3]OLO35223.1 thioesterase [Streptomyces sp. MNU77]
MNPWVVSPAPRPNPRLRMFCLPAAGSGASMYRAWARHLPDEVEVLPVQLPGRENRFDEAPAADYGAAVAALADGLAPLLHSPYVVFGHSMGALLSFGLAHHQRLHGQRQPERLLVSGAPAPDRYRPDGERVLSEVDDEQLVLDLQARGGTSSAALADPELLALVLPTLRADYQVCASMPTPAGEPFSYGISVFSGEEDTMTADELQDWKRWSHAETSVRCFPGGHFFLTEPSEQAVFEAVCRDLTAILKDDDD